MLRKKIYVFIIIFSVCSILLGAKIPASAEPPQKEYQKNIYVELPDFLWSAVSVEKFSLPRFEALLMEQNKNSFTNDNGGLVDDVLKNESPKQNESTSQDKITMKPDENQNCDKNYVGRFKIADVGVNVALYDSYSQDVVDKKDSAAYFYGWKHMIIADHKNQGFDKIKKCTVGMVAEIIEDNITTTYKCIAIMQGHNTGKTLTDNNGTLISEIYPGALVCYTCNENWKNITIVFFQKIKDENSDVSDTNNLYEPSYSGISMYSCAINGHRWGDWELAWEVLNDDGSYYGWDKRFCDICDDESWQQRTEPSTKNEASTE